ncbi:hypothetical protein KGF56_002130 [Candida oxycetoniae]|uniref:Uncharacterized protein n=1 Tax=Candida oxycetoniae TaxID=497107 RepID=A0AAI9WYP3_9ASCO|nr:uncharacterized protein KGF56_002130 [Candida oxycetoniae]KAI3405045.2 hypothetical protein KGF56_002130 [Candida oxycetoniae]
MLKEPIRGPITPSELLNDVEKLQNTRTSSIEHLPAFSFSKKPVSACSSETTGSNITTGLSQGTSKSKIKLSQPCEIMNFDYDEQIRYPRMRNGYFDISSSPRKGSFKKTASLEHEEAVTKSGNYEPTTKSGNYEPATFDINPTIRRFSTHVNDNLGQEYKKNNYIYGDSFESNLNLIHEMRKPMMTPAVLRPPAETKPPQFLTASYTIINIAENENPHIHNLPEFRYLKKFKRLKITQGYADLEEDANTSDRRMSIVDDVTTDWSWSSF